MSDTVLITGATGLIGSEITRQFREAGKKVHYLSRSRNKLKDEAGLQGFHWDPQNETMDPRALEGVGSVINLAGAPISIPWTQSNKKKIVQSRLSSLRTLYKAIERHPGPKPAHLASASAIGIYPGSYSQYYDETWEPEDSGFLGSTVSSWEAAATEFGKLGIPHALLRIGLVLSGDGGVLPQLVRPIRMYAGAVLGSGEQWQSWVHIRDVANMFCFCSDERLEGIYNAVAPNPVTQAKLIREAADVLNKPLWLPKVPAWSLKLVLGERSQLVLASQRVSCEKIREEGFGFEFPNLRPALHDLLD